MKDTRKEFEEAIAVCRDVFAGKLKDYGASWRIMRAESVTDQIYIKASRIRSLEVKGVAMVDEGVVPEWIAIVNYGVIGLIQLERGFAESVDLLAEESLALYDRHIAAATGLMLAKNHDYGEAWRMMRTSSFTDIILMKINRTKEIEGRGGKAEVSEGVDANYMDMINYALFGLIKLGVK